MKEYLNGLREMLSTLEEMKQDLVSFSDEADSSKSATETDLNLVNDAIGFLSDAGNSIELIIAANNQPKG